MSQLLRRNPRATLLLLSLVICGGCQRASVDEPAPATISSGNETVTAPPPPPTGPPQSYAAENDVLRFRVDLAAVRESSVGRDIAALVRSYPMWQRLLGRSGLDPVRDFDRILISASGAIGADSTIVVQHHLQNSDFRERVLRMNIGGEAAARWTNERGFELVTWPANTPTPQLLILTGPHELIVTQPDNLARTLDIAEDHRRRRQEEASIEPALQFEDGLMVDVRMQSLPPRARARIPHPPNSFALQIRNASEPGGAYQISAQAAFDNAETAQAAHTYLSERRDFFAGQMLVRAVGLDRPLRNATLSVNGAELEGAIAFNDTEIQRILGLVALSQVSSASDEPEDELEASPASNARSTEEGDESN